MRPHFKQYRIILKIDALETEKCLEFLEGCRLVPKTRRQVRTYWYILTVVYCAGRYYVMLFKGYQGMTQGELISLTIFNVVVDKLVCHWISVLVGEEVPEVWKRGVQIRDEYFYTGNVLIDSTKLE